MPQSKHPTAGRVGPLPPQDRLDGTHEVREGETEPVALQALRKDRLAVEEGGVGQAPAEQGAGHQARYRQPPRAAQGPPAAPPAAPAPAPKPPPPGRAPGRYAGKPLEPRRRPRGRSPPPTLGTPRRRNPRRARSP